MPRTRGKWTLGECPCRVNSSERFNPNASTRIKTSGVFGVATRRIVGPCRHIDKRGLFGDYRLF
jgi:hypothetical protein